MRQSYVLEWRELPDEAVRVGEAGGASVCTEASLTGVISMMAGWFFGAGFWAGFWAEAGWLYRLVRWTNLIKSSYGRSKSASFKFFKGLAKCRTEPTMKCSHTSNIWPCGGIRFVRESFKTG